MSTFSTQRFLGAVCLSVLLLTPREAAAQAVTGVVNGTVSDSTGAVVPGATVALLNENTGDKRDAVAASDGSFTFNGIFPGRYTVRIEAQGFKRLDKQNVNVTASERVALGHLVLEVGATTESVTVTAEGALVQTSSPERSSVLTSDQISNLASSGRAVLGLLRVLPGVSNAVDGGGLPNVNGLRTSFVMMTTDGTPNLELGTAFSSTRPHLDSIAEVKVITNNYQAEYGATAGAMIQIITKSGTSDFHGTGYAYRQHESWNANTFFNNINGAARSISRTTVYGYAIGGPVYIPGKFNVNKNKLFFFWTQELKNLPFQNGLRTRTVPTELERAGNFSQTLDTGNRLVPIYDPLLSTPTTKVQFAGNIIPTSRINATGQKLFSIFPQPNFTNRAVSLGNYNYTVQYPGKNPRRQFVTRVDYNLSSKIRLYVRGIRELNREYGSQYQDTTPRLLGLNYIPKNDIGFNSTQVISATLVNDFLVGMHHRSEYRSVAPEASPLAKDSGAALANYTQSKLGITLPVLYGQNAWNLVPGLNFGTDVPSAMALSWSQGGYFPPTTSERAWVISDSLTKIWGKHNTKAGIAINHRFRTNTNGGNSAGSFNFGRNVNNVDANYGYANALLGQFTSYEESTSTPLTKDTQVAYEWFLQDNWKTTRKLTLDYGVRFSWYTPFAQLDGKASNFIPELWSRSKAPTLFVPALNGTLRVARNPLTGAFAPQPQIGALVPNSGDPANGIALATDSGYPKGFLKNQGVLVGPRVGLAYDVFGDGKTAIRVGGGIFYQTQSLNGETVFAQNPPIQFTPRIYFGNFTDYFRATGVLFPSNDVRGYISSGQAPTVYNYSFGVQRDIGFGTVVDVAYVGNMSRHNAQTRDINRLPYGARFQPSAADTTRAGNPPLPDDFLRPYPGYGAINISDRTGNSNYNSLQVQANRRFARNIQFGASWTWSKSMGYDDNVATYQPARLWNYGPLGFDFTHIAVFNWLWNMPKVSNHWKNPVARVALDNWNLAGIATFQSGSPLNVSFTTTDGADLTGGGDNIRIDVVGSPYLSKSERTFYNQFDKSVFRRPARGTFGTLGRGLLRGPGVNNFDLTLSKELSVKERLRFRLLFEAFNAFNHTQFSGVDTAATFDASGAQTKQSFGRITSARAPRTGQVSLRVTF